MSDTADVADKAIGALKEAMDEIATLREQLDEARAERDVSQHLLTDLWKLYSGEGRPSHNESTMPSKCDACRFQADVERRVAMFLDPGYRPGERAGGKGGADG